MAKRKRTGDGDDSAGPVLRRSTRGAARGADEASAAATKAKTETTQKTTTQKTQKTKTTATASEKKPSSAAPPATPPGRQYWLLKAEPETRLENGVDVRFSIDDLAACTEPEPWDGIRNYAARNNLRAMKKGDLAFFYHSNCKTPGIVGTMEIVQEHSPDVSAHDPKAPYYDPSSKPDAPKWSVVHVVFRRKFRQPIPLPRLREDGAPGRPLEHMQMLRQTRLSVCRVSAAEWAYLCGVAGEEEEES